MNLGHSYQFFCPYCGSPNDIDTASMESRTLQDCEVCCRPISLRVRTKGGEIIEIDVRKENE